MKGITVMGHPLGRRATLILMLMAFAAFRCWSALCAEENAALKPPIHVLFVGGDWKSQIASDEKGAPLRGHFVKQTVEKAAPGRFAFTLWTSYEFLQYGDSDSLGQFDVIVAGDFMGGAVLPRLVKGLTDFVEAGGGFMYCDNHKAFLFYTRELSFDPVLPIEVVPHRPYSAEGVQPFCDEKPLKFEAAAAHPITQGLALSTAPAVGGAHYGKVKTGATVLAKSPGGKEIWVASERGKGRVFWAGGVFANDELSSEFSQWPEFGHFYAQALEWLAAHSTAPRLPLGFVNSIAGGELTVDLAQSGPEVKPEHFGITDGMEGAGKDPQLLAAAPLYDALNLTSTLRCRGPMPQLKAAPGAPAALAPKPAADWSDFNVQQYSVRGLDDIQKSRDPLIFAYFWNWFDRDPVADNTRAFAAALEAANGPPEAAAAKLRAPYFEIGFDWHHAKMTAETFPKYLELFKHVSSTLRQHYPQVKYGCGTCSMEWPYTQATIDACAPNLDWLGRAPYGQTGEAVFALQDVFLQHAKERGRPDLKFIITDWDFWLYGEPAFDYMMLRWKPLLDRADTCLATMQTRWIEYSEGGYAYGLIGRSDTKYGVRPAAWPNPGKGKPNTYRYNAHWVMRNCRGKQYAAKLEVPAWNVAAPPLTATGEKKAEKPGEQSTRAYAVATSNGQQYNIVIYYGYPYMKPEESQSRRVVSSGLVVNIKAPIPSEIKGRTLVIERADARERKEEPPRPISGDALDFEVELPAQSAVSLTVR